MLSLKKATVLAGIFYAASTVHAAQTNRFHLNESVGVYSDMCMHPESGDALGVRAIVMDMQSDLFIVLQEAEGWPTEPFITKARMNGNKIEFDVFATRPTDMDTPEKPGANANQGYNKFRTTFSGEITQDVIKGTFADGTDYYHKFGKDGKSYGDSKTYYLKRETGKTAGKLSDCD